MTQSQNSPDIAGESAYSNVSNTVDQTNVSGNTVSHPSTKSNISARYNYSLGTYDIVGINAKEFAQIRQILEAWISNATLAGAPHSVMGSVPRLIKVMDKLSAVIGRKAKV